MVVNSNNKEIEIISSLSHTLHFGVGFVPFYVFVPLYARQGPSQERFGNDVCVGFVHAKAILSGNRVCPTLNHENENEGEEEWIDSPPNTSSRITAPASAEKRGTRYHQRGIPEQFLCCFLILSYPTDFDSNCGRIIAFLPPLPRPPLAGPFP